MVEAEKVRESGIVIPDTVAAKYQPDYGVVFDPGSCFVNREIGGRVKGCKCPGCQGLKAGMLVGVKPYTGVWYTHKDFDWIPEGRIVKIVGTVDTWTDNIPFYLEL